MSLGNTPAEFGNLVPTSDNYSSLVDFKGTPHLPALYKDQIKRYGNRMLGGFLSAVSAEEAISNDKVQWTEEGRLHMRYTATKGAEQKIQTDGTTTAEQFTITGPGTAADHGIRVGMTVIVSDDTGLEYKGRVDGLSGTNDTVVTLKSFTKPSQTATDSTDYDAGFDGLKTTASNITMTVYGSEYKKGSDALDKSSDREYTDRENVLTIQRGGYDINGSDFAQIGWIETFSEGGQSNNYFWWHTSELDERERFEDNIEMTGLEAVPAEDGSTLHGTDTDGSEGLFYVLENEGNEFTGGLDDSDGKAGREDIDVFVKQLDKQGAIEENLFYLDRDQSLAFDNIMAQQSSGGTAVGTNTTITNGTNFGVFNNNADMALNLGFKSVMRGSYTFHKTDWKYLNDYAGRSGHGSSSLKNVQGVMIPGGSKNVYDQGLGKLMNRPFLHVRYRQAGIENRKFKNWVTGSVGAKTSGTDKMEVHYLTERCLVTQAPNNFFILKRN